MGAVFLAVDEQHRAVALKMIAAGSSDPFARERFEREIAALSAIRHANIVRLLRAGQFDGAPFALMERVRGRPLSRVGPQPWPVVVGLGRQVAHAIAAVHAAGWLHRDLKRSNVMVGDRGLITLIDFGLAKRWCERDARNRCVRPTAPGLTEVGKVVGTPRYLAPEIRRGERATAAVDVYSLGLVLHELLGGKVDAEGRMTRMPDAVPPALRDLIVAALEREPHRRPTADSIAGVLDMLPSLPGLFASHRHDDVPTWPIEADRQPTRAAG